MNIVVIYYEMHLVTYITAVKSNAFSKKFSKKTFFRQPFFYTTVTILRLPLRNII